MKNKYIIYLLCFMLLWTSFPSTMDAEKKDEKGEVLNFAPFVNFELKEKEKIDVIVDVGNTEMTMDQANSYVNQTIRPALQSSGKDYKIHVEKSSEGNTKLYYFNNIRYAVPGMNSEFRMYDLSTKQNKLIRADMRSVDYYTYKNGYTGITVPLDYDFDDPRIVESRNNIAPTYRNDEVWYNPVQEIIYFTGGSNNLGFVYDPIHDMIMQYKFPTFVTNSDNVVRYLLPNNNVYADSSYASGSGREGSRITYRMYRDSQNNIEIFPIGDNSGNSYTTYYEGAGGWYFGLTRNETSSSVYYNIYAYPLEGKVAKRISGGSDFKTSSHVVRVAPFSSKEHTIFFERTQTYPLTHMIKSFDHETQLITTIVEDILAQAGTYFALDDGRVFFRKSSTDYDVYVLADRTNPNSEITKAPFHLRNRTITNVIGSYIIVDERDGNNNTGNYTGLAIHVDTGEETIIVPKNHSSAGNKDYSFAKHVSWAESQSRTIEDIVNEGLYRPDAQKYYVRIDDNTVSQLASSKTLATTANLFLQHNITFIGIGNGQARPQHDSFITTINGQGLYINGENKNQGFSKAAEFIEQYKKAYVLIVQGDQSYTAAQLELMADQIKKTLGEQNIGVQMKIIQDTTTNLFELLDRQSWYNDMNQYVLYIHRGAAVPLSNEGLMTDIAALLRGNYAFVIGNSSTTNQAHFNALIETNDQQGMVTTSAAYSTVASAAAHYIIQSAIPNPKRISDTLVLQRDPITGEYTSEVIVTTFYEDFENDRKRNERFKTTHDPTVYENHSGVMEGIGQYHESPTTKFTKVGRYEMVVQVQDEPVADNRFNEYWHWSKDSLSQLVLYVHRAPVAEFTTIVNSARRLTITDYSYDLDRYSQYNKGITTWEWKWKRVDDAAWTPGSPPTTLQANTDYLISLKVKDIDGAWSTETIKFVTTSPYNQPPVALFTVDPATVSHNKSANITDLSYDPDGDAIVAREWKVYRDKQLLLEASTKPTIASIKQAAQAKGLQVLGNYRIELRVQDQPGLWSDTHREMIEVINHAPIADFEPIEYTYRDTVNTIINTTVTPDLDGDNVSYNWTLLYNDQRYALGTARNASFKIKDRGLGKKAVGTWMLELKASDPLGAHSFMTHSFEVLNQIPTTKITSGPSTGYIQQPYTYTSNGHDEDTEDNPNLQSFWRLTTPSGKTKTWTTKDITITYDEKGLHTLENWVVDPLDAKSEVDQMEVMIENLIPIPGFTMNPNPTYRGVEVSFKSTATDLDGYIDNHFYYVTTPGSTSKTYLGSLADFIRSFSSVGDLKIEQVVVDNDGAEARLEQTLSILNRKPRATVMVPSGKSSADATQFNTLTPTIEWTMQDADGDLQQRYQVQIKQENGTVLYTSNEVSSSSKTFIIPTSVALQENTIYRATVRVYDGYEWSDYAVDKYFYILLNRPPVPGFTWEPTSIWEGDQVTIKHGVADPDHDTLSIRYELTSPNGQRSYYPSSSSYYEVTSSQYTNNAFTITNAQPGRYSIIQTVSDGKADSVSLTKSFNVGELTVLGKVLHTGEWEAIRQKHNDQQLSDKWMPNQFLAGEKLILQAATTTTTSGDLSITHATKVEAIMLLHNSRSSLQRSNELSNDWNGEMWEEKFENLKNGYYDIIFYATYSNGIIKQDIVTIEIVGKAESIAGVHRLK